MASALHSFKNDHARFLVDIFKLARDDGVGRSRLSWGIPNRICAGDDGIPGRAWLRNYIRSKMIILGFRLIFSSLPGMTGLGDGVFPCRSGELQEPGVKGIIMIGIWFAILVVKNTANGREIGWGAFSLVIFF